jgi:DNA topoisomerase II
VSTASLYKKYHLSDSKQVGYSRATGLLGNGYARLSPSCSTSNASYARRWKSSSASAINDDDIIDSGEPNNVETTEGATIEERYSRKTPLEHVLLRPGMYIGDTERTDTTSWVLSSRIPPPLISPATIASASASQSHLDEFKASIAEKAQPPKKPLQFVTRDVSVAPALLKVFDEILVNASDHRFARPDSQASKAKTSKSSKKSSTKSNSATNVCTRIDVFVHPGDGESEPRLMIRNNGPGIPVQIHRTENMYVPTLLFGHLMTGSNFDDTKKRITGGRHGYGAKLTNIFAKEFVVKQRSQCYGISIDH